MDDNEVDAVQTHQDLVVLLIPALRGYARYLTRNPEDADDLVQETLLRAIEHGEQFQSGTNLRAWLFTILRNRFYTSRRKATREPVGSDECVAGLPVTLPVQDLHMEVRDVERAFRRLPPQYQRTFAYIVLDGESYIEAAEHFRCELGTIKSRVNRSRRLLQEMLADR